MSQGAWIGGLADDLIHIVAGFSPTNDAEAYKTCKDATLKNLRHHRLGRTDPFHVQSSLDGLLEKFRILNNDPVAAALDVRLKRIGSILTDHKQEILSFLLNLADRPAEKSKVESLDALRPPTPSPSLICDDIFKSDSLNEGEIWDYVDYRATSSDEDTVLPLTAVGSEDNVSTTPSDENACYDSLQARSMTVSVDENSLLRIRRLHAGRLSAGPPCELEELELVRQVLHMLQGLPSDLFEDIPGRALLSPLPGILIPGCSEQAVNSTLQCLGVIATNLNSLRDILRKPCTKPLIQAFLAFLSTALREFEAKCASIEQRLVHPTQPGLVSLLDLQNEVECHSPFLMRLNSLTVRITDEIFENSYRLLDYLLSETNDAQMEGDTVLYSKFAQMFLSCLEVYLRPIWKWIEEGEIEARADSFPIQILQKDVELSTFWHSKFQLRRQAGLPQTPTFLQTFLERDIFGAGKSVAFVKQLGLPTKADDARGPYESILHCESMYHTDPSLILFPFSENLHMFLEAWINRKQLRTWPRLRAYITTHSTLYETINALQILYLSANGYLFDKSMGFIASHLDSGSASSSNCSMMESNIRTQLEESEVIEPSRLTLLLDPRITGMKGLRRLEAFQLSYTYPWPVANIIQPSSLIVYQQTWHLLIQLKCAFSTLSSLRLRPALMISKYRPLSNLALCIRHRLTHTLSTVLSHVTQQVLHIFSGTLNTNLVEANKFDDMVAAHTVFVAAIEKGCMLLPVLRTSREALRGVCDLAMLFTQSQQMGPINTVYTGHSRPRKQLSQMRAQLDQLLEALVQNLRAAVRDEKDASDASWEVLASGLICSP